MRYYIADCHFFHRSLNDRMDCRGFESAEAMNEYMIAKWNAKVRASDEVVVLGDFSYGTADETDAVLKRLKGRLYLVEGNHDAPSVKNPRFIWVLPYKELHDNGRKVVLSHYPIMCYNGQYRVSASGKPRAYMLYGHVHDSFDQRLLEKFQAITRATKREVYGHEEPVPIPCNMINCFCKYSDYTPLSLDEWIANDLARRAAAEPAA
ncbi:MAG: metallophosphoesterase family protein [Candidatus Spyradosoma sp.]